jgi:hypothetical protein
MENTSVLYRHDLAKEVALYLPDNPHTFLVDLTAPGGLAIAAAAQAQIAGFLQSDGTSIPDANTNAVKALFLGRTLFENPAPLLEDLNF